MERIQNGNGQKKNEEKKRSLERKHETMTRGVFSVDKRQQENKRGCSDIPHSLSIFSSKMQMSVTLFAETLAHT